MNTHHSLAVIWLYWKIDYVSDSPHSQRTPQTILNEVNKQLKPKRMYRAIPFSSIQSAHHQPSLPPIIYSYQNEKNIFITLKTTLNTIIKYLSFILSCYVGYPNLIYCISSFSKHTALSPSTISHQLNLHTCSCSPWWHDLVSVR